MNGEFLELFEKIQEWSKQVHDQRHRENLTKFEKLFHAIECLPCKTHVETLRWHSMSIKCLWGVLIIGGLMTMAMKYWG